MHLDYIAAAHGKPLNSYLRWPRVCVYTAASAARARVTGARTGGLGPFTRSRAARKITGRGCEGNKKERRRARARAAIILNRGCAAAARYWTPFHAVVPISLRYCCWPERCVLPLAHALDWFLFCFGFSLTRGCALARGWVESELDAFMVVLRLLEVMLIVKGRNGWPLAC